MGTGGREALAWQQLVDEALDAFVAVDGRGVIVEFNPAAARLFGRERGEVLGRTLGEVLVPPRILSGHPARFARAVGPGRAELVGRRIEMPALRADGRELRVEFAVTLLADSPPVFGGFVHDLTESRNIHRALRARTVLLEEAAELAHLGTWEWDPAAGVMTWSDEMYAIYGVPRGSFEPTPEFVLERVSDEDRPGLDAALDVLRKSGVMPRTEWRVVRPDGVARWVVGTARVASEPEARGRRLVGTVRDVTDERVIRDELGAVHAVAETLADWESFDKAAEELLSGIGNALGWVAGVFWMPDERGGRLRCRTFWTSPRADAAEFEAATRSLSLSRGPDSPPGRAWITGAPVWIVDAADDVAFQRRAAAAAAGLHGGVAFPISADGRMLGCLEFYGREARPSGDRQRRTLAALGEELGRFLDRRGFQFRRSSLTPREREILQLAARGRSTPQIAEDLVISQSTVKTHFEKIYDRLNVRDRPAAVAEGFRRGLLT